MPALRALRMRAISSRRLFFDSISRCNQLPDRIYIIGRGGGEAFRGEAAAVPDRPSRRERKVSVDQVNAAAIESSADIEHRNIMSSQTNAPPHTRDRLLWIG